MRRHDFPDNQPIWPAYSVCRRCGAWLSGQGRWRPYIPRSHKECSEDCDEALKQIQGFEQVRKVRPKDP